LGLIAVWFVEFFKRSGVPQPVPVMQPVIQIAYTPNEMPVAAIPSFGAPAARLPETILRFPRELSGPEVYALWDAASPQARLVIAALLGGLTLDELTALRYEDIDFDAGLIRENDASPRPSHIA
jgi:integrase